MSYALIFRKTVIQIESKPFPVSESFQWVGINPDEVSLGFIYDANENTFAEPDPEIKPIEKIDPINNLIQAIYLFLTEKIDIQSLDGAYKNAQDELNKLT